MVEKSTFFQYIHDMFDHLDDRPYLAAHPLAALLCGKPPPVSAEALCRALFDAIEDLRPTEGTAPGSTNWRRWRCMTLRYVDGASTKQIARELQVSDRQTLRDNLAGIRATAQVLWARFGRVACSTVKAADAPTSNHQTGEPRPSDPAFQEDFETELARVAVTPPDGATNVVEALEGALMTVRSLAEEHQARLEVSIAHDLRPVSLSQTVVRQVFLCLLTASLIDGTAPWVQVEATNAPSCVQVVFSVETRKARGSVELENDGEEESLIATARRMVEPEGGNLYLESSGSGQQSFALTLPTAPTVKVLVIDDNPYIAQLFRWYLAGRNYYVVQARTPPTALELAHSLLPEVITLDVMMPSQDGWQILQHLRTDPDLRNVPVIVCSILPEQPLARSLGVADFLAKPITQQSLLAALERCLAKAGSPAYRDSPSDTSPIR